MKKLFLCFLLPLYMYAAEQFEPFDLSAFDYKTKLSFTDYVDTWVHVAQEENISLNQGLAKIFFDMQHDGVDKVFTDEAALKRANEYVWGYYQSATSTICHMAYVCLKPGRKNSYCFDAAQPALDDLQRILRQYEFHNILSDRHELPQMPRKDLINFYNKDLKEQASILLKLNENNQTIQSATIRGYVIALMYLEQKKVN